MFYVDICIVDTPWIAIASIWLFQKLTVDRTANPSLLGFKFFNYTGKLSESSPITSLAFTQVL